MTETTIRELPAGPQSAPGQPEYDLDDRYRPGSGRVLLTGVQAIARQLVEQQVRDLRAGRRVGTFVSGYPGSPLAGVDSLLHGIPQVLAEHDIAFTPGMNEEIAATAVWGSQADLGAGTPTHDGVVGVWYGKGPGLDRATDALRHANMYGVNPAGGVLLMVGDDPASKSSTVPAVSERSLAALGIPVLFPRNAEEIVTMGQHGVALSRASGCIVALKIVADVADGSWSVDGGELTPEITVPRIEWDGKSFEYVQRPLAAPGDSVIAEKDLYGPRRAVVEAYGEANGLDVIEVDPAGARLGVAATGTAFDAVRQGLKDLGLDDGALHRAGIRLLRIGMPSPLGTARVREFADGLDELLVVEDKTAFVEAQIREILYGTAQAPRILGKRDRAGRPLMPVDGELTTGRMLAPLRHVLEDHAPGLIAPAKRPLPPALSIEPLSAHRTPYFCSGCPHNRSTALPDGSIGGGGIGCHTLVTVSGRTDSAVTGLTQMGGEGTQWIGQAPFTDVPHTFQNLGDGTYYHSGQLAVQACVAAGVNITYKILHNDVVAMTGAQDAEGALTVAALTRKLALEGVAKIIVCADEPERHLTRVPARFRRAAVRLGVRRPTGFADNAELWHRDRLDEAQRLLRDVPGVTVLVYDQHCAADARRQRKRGTLPARNTRVVINPAVCEGCGDCGVKSNCLSVQPMETEFGTKTRIDQTSCNTDYSCMDGDCPAFVTVQAPDGPAPRHDAVPEPPAVPAPDDASAGAGTRSVFIAGIGGTGIVTVNQVLATAAMRAGFDVESLDQIGMSQKAGPVVSHLRFARGTLEPANRVTPGSATGILALDLLTAAEERNLAYGVAGRTLVAASTSRTPTGDMVYDRSVHHPDEADLLDRVGAVARRLESIDALAAAEELFGDTTAANFLVVGAAHQMGALPIPAEAIEEAIGINGRSVDQNIAAFRWGRAAVAEPGIFAAAAAPAHRRRRTAVPPDLRMGLSIGGEARTVALLRAGELIDFQGEALAGRYLRRVQRAWDAEQAAGGSGEFAEAVARGLYKLTAYKDEYEVARLLTDPAFADAVQGQVPGGTALTFKLHPPTLKALGRTRKVGFGPRSHTVLRALAHGRRLRGTRLDPFGHTAMRRLERGLLANYEATVDGLLAELHTVDGYARAVEFAGLPEMIRGYEDVKLANVEAYRERLAGLGIPDDF
ncbi:indolepyruvate ferredoxin oxidoreductase family protein [Tomitella fengzijianii]|uniref:Indolepyruvate ferredoxin oxidoreductase family protein n=1 Tax=Tomitella fengzijianii TaxID=2597660 RepID=A0A516WZD4_9ACTN|nr:indolepyruvate ferredoxin oxidoreductase family protein [Tomitella fengzijianii]QDQ96216.1 indolepyruvate ferredoxin oxidoreductase family protein [Tomitella fengzijianii]